MKQGVVVPALDDPIPLYGGVWDTIDDEQEFIQTVRDNFVATDALSVEGHELMTTFSVFGAGFTAPKGKIKLSFELEAFYLEQVMPLVKYADGKKLMIMVFAPQAAFDE